MMKVSSDRIKITVFMVAFLQGMLDLYSLPLFYYFKDTLKATAAQLSFLSGLAMLPWCIKPLFGFLSDQVPILGKRRKSYLIIVSAIEFCLLLYIGFRAKTIFSTVICQVSLVACLVFRNVIGEALVVGISKESEEDRHIEMTEAEKQQKAQKSVSLFFGARAFGSLIANYFTGKLAESSPHHTSFVICSGFSIAVILVALFVYKEEEEAIVEQPFFENMRKIGGVIINPKIRALLVLVILLIITPTYGQAFNYYFTEFLHFGPQTMGQIIFLSSVAYLFGIFMVNTLFSGVSFKGFYSSTTLLTGLMNLSCLILLFRWNQKLGISDEFFCLSNSALSAFISELNFLPVMAFTCRLCPPGLEGSTYAVFTAIFNLAYYLSTLIGSFLVLYYNVTKTDFSNLYILVCIQVAYCFVFGIIIMFYSFPVLDDQNAETNSLEDAEMLITNHLKTKRPRSSSFYLQKTEPKTASFLIAKLGNNRSAFS